MKEARERQIPYDMTSVWNLKKDIIELIYKKTHRIQSCGYQGESGARDKLGVWINRYSLLHVKEYIYVCVTESLSCTPEINSTL